MTRAETLSEERKVFELFAARADLGLVPGSIVQPNPPDIVYSTREFPRVAFELTRLDDAAELTHKSDWMRGGELWESALCELQPTDRERLSTQHGDLQIDLVIAYGKNQRMRRDAFRALATRLLSISPDFEGRMTLDRESAEGSVIRSATFRRFPSIRSRGPVLNEIHAGWTAPVAFDRIDKKIAPGEYTVNMRLELLAYARWNAPLSIHHHDAAGYLAQRIPGSRFARAWVYEVMTDLIIEYLLSGTLKCASCGASFVIADRYHYACSSLVHGRACANDARIKRRDVEAGGARRHQAGTPSSRGRGVSQTPDRQGSQGPQSKAGDRPQADRHARARGGQPDGRHCGRGTALVPV
jgi:hypothetical protein